MKETVRQFIFISPQKMNYDPEDIFAETDRSPEAKTSVGWCG
jgi:hypothetical protein